MSSLTLYVDSQFASPYAMSAFVALTEKQVAFDLVSVDQGKRDHYQSEYSTTLLTKRVPTLVHDGFVLSESSAIDEYIDEVFPGIGLYPTNPKDRARARQVQSWLRSDLMPIRTERNTLVIFYNQIAPALSGEGRAAAQKLFFFAEHLLTEDEKNLFGEWSIADVDIALMLQRLICNGDSVPPRLVNYADHHWRRPSVQAWLGLQRPRL